MARITAVTHQIDIVKTDGTTQTEAWNNAVMGGRPSASRFAAMCAKTPTIASATLRHVALARPIATWARSAS